MKNKDIEKSIRAVLDADRPDEWTNIARQTVGSSEKAVGKPHRKRRMAAAFSSAAALITAAVLLAVFLLPGGRAPQPGAIRYGAGGYVYMDINPSLQIKLDKDGKVTDIAALNADGRVMLAGGADYSGLGPEQAAVRLLDEAVALGYISPVRTNNAVLVSAALEDKASVDLLNKSLKKAMLDDVKQKGIYCAVLTDAGGTVSEQAAAYGITAQKMRLILSARQVGAAIDESEYASISVAEMYSRMLTAADKYEEAGDYADELDELEDRAEEAAERLLKKAERILEKLDDYVDSADAGDEAEEAVERLSDILELLEDAAADGADMSGIFASLKAGADALKEASWADDETVRLLDELKTEIDRIAAGFVELNEKINADRIRLQERYGVMKDNAAVVNGSYEKPDDFDDLFDNWLDTAEESFALDWEKLKDEWEKTLRE